MHTQEWAEGGVGLAGHLITRNGYTIGAFWYADDCKKAIAAVNALAGIPDPAKFMDILEELMTAIESVPELNPSNYHHNDVADCERAKADMFDVWNRLRAARGPKGVGK